MAEATLPTTLPIGTYVRVRHHAQQYRTQTTTNLWNEGGRWLVAVIGIGVVRLEDLRAYDLDYPLEGDEYPSLI